MYSQRKGWEWSVTLLSLAVCVVLTGAQHEPGYCSFYEDCGRNPAVEGALIPPRVPCKDYRKAVNVTGAHYELFKSVCPMLANGDGQTLGCCSYTQLKSLEGSLTLSRALLVRCPSCADNFAHLHCATTCSPNQSQILTITKTVNITQPSGIAKEAVVGYEAYMSTNFSDASFRSCRNVRIPSTGGFAIATMCGRYGATLCTPQRWYDFQGDSSNGLAPLDINFMLLPEGQTAGLPQGTYPFAGKALNCNEMTPTGGEACSCQDCEQSCPAIPPPPPIPKPFMIGRLNGVLVICVAVFACIFFLFMCYLVLECTSCYQKSRSARKGKSTKDQNENEINRKISPKDVKCSDKASLATQDFLGSLFQTWGTLMARYPLSVLLVCLVVVIAFTVGIKDIELTTDPVQLWSAPESRAMREKNFHDTHFDPFYRTNQLILTAPNRPSHSYDSLLFGQQNFSGIISKDLIIELLELQKRIQAIEFWSDDLNRTASLKDVCYAPLNPDNPSLTDCAVNSLPQYFQNSIDNLNAKANMTELGVTKEVDWRDHFIYCVNSPLSFKDITALGMSCMSDYGGPVFPFLAVGGYENEAYTVAEALILTFSLNNYGRSDVKFKVVQQWESMFLKIVQEYQKNPNTNFTFAYMAERSLEDEINRTTAEDIPIFMISYAVIFLYIAVALGEYSSWKRILVDSKFLVGLGGIVVVGCSVLASMGFYAWIGLPSSLVILQVVPFLVLAVGADNIFIFVLEYQRDMRRPGEEREEHIGRVLGNVAPSMLLCSLSESVCFFLGALSTMPAVKSFALYAALAVLMDFILQMTAFVALLSLDARRQDANRCEIACCVTVRTPRPSKPNQGFLLPLMKKYYAPALLNPVSRVIVILVFLVMFCASVFLGFNVKVGLDQELAMPSDSYMLNYFAYLNKYFEVGVPTYFITTKGFNFTSAEGLNAVCSSVGCDQFSFTQKIRYATEYSDRSYLAVPASSWVDDFIDWLNPGSKCCRIYTSGPNIGTFCPANETNNLCRQKCMEQPDDGVLRPSVEEFYRFLPDFLSNRPDLQCPKGGLGAYDKAVIRDKETGEVIASRFMAYHTPLVNSQEFTGALEKARELARNITLTMRKVNGTSPDFEVFPYTVTYVYYEQYLTIVNEGLFNIAMCLLPTFFVCCILLGMDLRSGFLNLLTIVMITVDTVGVMTLWGIDFNAVSLINLVTAVGISVEFVSHITRSFALSIGHTKVERAKEATANMGSAVFAGVAMTNLPGIIVLAFAKAQLIQIFFFRLNLVITLLGMAHGLIFLPVLLSFLGPGVNNALLLQIQEKKEKEMELKSKATYDNVSFENHEKTNGEIPVGPSCPVTADVIPNTSQKPNQWDIAVL
ncbi:NPC1-like intracellular cholesterol transporter 1 [Pimephales promelas]|uniref:NPC1-like intracellular cholesterol transporter 1 n=1 Tax=Pimephales promelas TaxID=90988 RepID=UPI001955C590|nr:NPC1-like intracellular cholesterol transporter 1 [Pimephales promelas]KAG1930943.1 NPC intracellular cholesterol transporter [Pimephales promelas]